MEIHDIFIAHFHDILLTLGMWTILVGGQDPKHSFNFLRLLHRHIQLLLSISPICQEGSNKYIYLSLHNVVKDSFRKYDFIYTDGSVSDNKAAAAVINDSSSFERLPDKSSIFSAELHALYFAPDRVEKADDDESNFIIFSDSKFAL